MIAFPKKILAGSSNQSKLSELRTVAAERGVEIISPIEASNLYGLGDPPDPIEDADSYRGNAIIKAKALFAWAKIPTIADDSGLEVEALANRPGVYSARYGGPSLTDKERYELLLKEVKEVWRQSGVINRKAAFVCNLVFIPDNECVYYSDSRIEGIVLDEPKGGKGFGYDPIVFIDSIGATLAEVDFSVTCAKGFRGQALRGLLSQFTW